MDEPMAFSFNGDDLPEGIRDMLRKMVAHSMSAATGLAHDHNDRDILPAKEQLEISPGDYVVLMNDPGDSDAVPVGRVLDAAHWAHEFSDWEDRLLKSYLLVEYQLEAHRVEMGWFPRSGLCPVSKDQHEILVTWLSGETPNEPPGWLIVRYGEICQGISENNDGNVKPFPITCPNCDSPGILVTLESRRAMYLLAGTETRNEVPWKTLYEVSPQGEVQNSRAFLKCYGCEYTQDIPDSLPVYRHG